jgi:hypothetical protein
VVCWARAYFEKKVYFECRHNFGEKVYFGKDLILERTPNFGMRTIDGKKATCRKRRKRNMQRKKAMWHAGQASLTMIGLGFVIKIVMTISLENNINKNLGGLGWGFGYCSRGSLVVSSLMRFNGCYDVIMS